MADNCNWPTWMVSCWSLLLFLEAHLRRKAALTPMSTWNLSESLHPWESFTDTYEYLESLWIPSPLRKLHWHLCLPGIPLNPFTLEKASLTPMLTWNPSESLHPWESCTDTYEYLESLWIPSPLRKLHWHLCLPGIPLNPFTLEKASLTPMSTWNPSESLHPWESCTGTYEYLESLWIPSPLRKLHWHLWVPGIPLNPFTLEKAALAPMSTWNPSESLHPWESCTDTHAYLESLWIPSPLRKLHWHLCLPGIPLNPFTLEKASLTPMSTWNPSESLHPWESCTDTYEYLESLWIPSPLRKLHWHLWVPGIPLNPFTLEKAALTPMLTWNPSESLHPWESFTDTYEYLESLWIPSPLRKLHWHLWVPGIPLNPFTLEKASLTPMSTWNPSEPLPPWESCTDTYEYLESLWISSPLRKLHWHLCLPGIPLNPFTLEKASLTPMSTWNPSESLHPWESCTDTHAYLESLWISSPLRKLHWHPWVPGIPLIPFIPEKGVILDRFLCLHVV